MEMNEDVYKIEEMNGSSIHRSPSGLPICRDDNYHYPKRHRNYSPRLTDERSIEERVNEGDSELSSFEDY